jgi:hypothetical protein
VLGIECTHSESVRIQAWVMSFDFSTLFWIIIAITLLQPLLAARWYVVRRAQAYDGLMMLPSLSLGQTTRNQNRCIFVFEQDYQELGWHRLVLRPYLTFGRSSLAALAALAGLAGALSTAMAAMR